MSSQPSPKFMDRFKKRSGSEDKRSLSQVGASSLDEESFGTFKPEISLIEDVDSDSKSRGAPDRSQSDPEVFTFHRGSDSNSFSLFNQSQASIKHSSRAQRNNEDPAGLTPLYVSPSPAIDIIFVHGLGSSSLKCWSWGNDVQNCWLPWLQEDQELSRARIWTFGYSGGVVGSTSSVNIMDFAKELLSKLKHESTQGPSIGQLPIVFVSHSMGGLVTKKAYLHARHSEHFKDLSSNVRAMIFFSTPHRGGKMADSLSTILKLVGMSKEYIKELTKDSSFLPSINEDFTQACNDLKLYSFYETKKTMTPMGLKLVVDKESGIIHLPTEINMPMTADHHNICKFESREDPRFKDIRNVLSSLVRSYAAGGREGSCSKLALPPLIIAVHHSFPVQEVNETQDLADLLSINVAALDDILNRSLSSIKAGTCEWITRQPWFSSWLRDDSDDPHVLWISGQLAAGKSVLAAYIAQMIRDRCGPEACQYHAFNFSDQPSRSASYLFRSFAYQISRCLPTLHTELERIVQRFDLAFSSMNAITLWEKIFRGALFSQPIGRTLYWVIDGLDEAEPETIPLLFHCLKTISSGTGIRILLVSRETTEIAMRIEQLGRQLKLTSHHLSSTDTMADIRVYVEDAIGSVIPKSVISRQRIVDQVLKKASGNFLWVTLATKDLEQSWHRQSNIAHALSGFPGEMAPRYDRMMERIDGQPQHLKRMATVLLLWVTYSFRPLRLTELRTALDFEFPDLTSLEDIIQSICGDFILFQGKRLTLVHETARHYLMHKHPKSFHSLNSPEANEYMAMVCLSYLSSSKERPWRQILNLAEIGRSRGSHSSLARPLDVRETWPLLSYAATSWAYHLSLSRAGSERLLQSVQEFFANDALTWINTLALMGDLKSLIKAAQYLRAYLKNRERIADEKPTPNQRNGDTEPIRLWAIDLIRLVGKFGTNLTQNPSAIYKLIPPFCPKSSMLANVASQSTFSIVGVSVADWDDCHARLSVGTEGSGRRVIATSEVFAALVPGAQSLVVWHAQTCEEILRLNHAEYVTQVAVNKKGDLVCTAGRETIQVWDLTNGDKRGTLSKHSDDRILAVGFGVEDDLVLIGYQDHLIVCQNWRTGRIVYEFHAVVHDESNVHNGLRVVSFSPDGTRLAVGSRNRPVDLWNLTTQTREARCVTEDEVANAEDDVFLQPEVVSWHPTSGNIYILYHNTTLIDWNPVYDEKIEHAGLRAKGMTCSPCGNYLLSFDAGGSIDIYELPDYSQAQQASELHAIYHLDHPEHVRDVAFDPDGRRFYDLRDATCSVWEPEVLVPPDRPDRESRSSPYDNNWTSSVAATTVHESDLAQVTAIACAPNDIGFCSGHDDGNIYVHEMTNGVKVRSLQGHAADMAIIGLTWSSSGRWIASADDSGRVLVRKIIMPTRPDEKMVVYRPSDFRIHRDGVNQLLFSSSDRYLLVSTLSADRIWDLEEKRICRIREHASPRRIKWIEHPSDPSRLVSIDAGEVHIFHWDDFVDLTPGDGLRFIRTDQHSITGKRKISDAAPDPTEDVIMGGTMTGTNAEHLDVNSITQTNDSRSIVLETLPRNGYDRDRLKRRRLEYLQTRDLSPTHGLPGELVLKLSAPELTREVSKLVGSFQNRLVFFNHQHWLCTWEVGTAVNSYKRHLFLPKDWVSSETLRLNALSDQGTLLCPRNGSVAIIKNGIKL